MPRPGVIGPIILALAAVLATGAVTEAATVHSSGTATMVVNDGFELDAGLVSDAARVDLVYGVNADDPKEPIFGIWKQARGRQMGLTRPTLATCRAATLRNYAQSFRQIPAGTWFCVRTDDGRYARLKVLASPRRASQPFSFSWRTWS
jgi:hypothetical protein